MKCFVCDGRGRETEAVAICRDCSIGLCREHLVEESRAVGAGGLKYRCTHTPLAVPAPQRI
jgi:hypothetical protein